MKSSKIIKMDGLIDDLAAAVARDELSGGAFSAVKRHIMRQDAIDAVEVVRCKDCWHYNTDKGYCGFWGEYRPENHFCAEGIREES